jgi:uncharacterized protein with ParB-like and HNH nuclease domain
MDTTASNRRLRVLLTAIGSGALEPQPDFQRRLVWINKDKIEFIKTVLEGYPFPEIYIAAGSVDTHTGEGAELLVDGQQRLTTLYQYFKGSTDIRLGTLLPAYADLDEEARREFLEYTVVVRDLGNMPLNQIKEVFQKINSTSYGLNAMEIHNARYNGAFKNLANELSELSFFDDARIFTATDVKRMNDVMFCASILATVLSNYFTRDNDIESFFERYNDSFSNKDVVLENAKKVLSFISQMNFPQKSRVFKKADFYTLFVETYNLIVKKQVVLNVSKTRVALDAFYLSVDEASNSANSLNQDALRYYKAALQASNDRTSRVLRGEIVGQVIKSAQ